MPHTCLYGQKTKDDCPAVKIGVSEMFNFFEYKVVIDIKVYDIDAFGVLMKCFGALYTCVILR